MDGWLHGCHLLASIYAPLKIFRAVYSKLTEISTTDLHVREHVHSFPANNNLVPFHLCWWKATHTWKKLQNLRLICFICGRGKERFSQLIHCVKCVQIRRFFWFQYRKIWKNSVFGHFSRSDCVNICLLAIFFFSIDFSIDFVNIYLFSLTKLLGSLRTWKIISSCLEFVIGRIPCWHYKYWPEYTPYHWW